MDGTVAPLLSCLAFAAGIGAWLLVYLQRRPGWPAKALLLYFGLCLSLILLRWHFQPDLAMYDTSKYQNAAAQIAALLRADFWGNLPYILKPHAAYTVPLGLLYFLFGTSEPLGQLLNTVLGLGIILNLHRLAALWFSRRTADLASLAMALCPVGWLLGSTLNRDMMVVFSITFLFRMLSGLPEKGGLESSFGRLAGILASLLWMTLLRPPLLILGGLAVLVFWLVGRRGSPRSFRLSRILKWSNVLLVAALGSLAFIAAGNYYRSDAPFDSEIPGLSDMESMNRRLRVSEAAGSAYFQDVSYSSFGDVLRAMPLAAFYFLFSPLPWQVTTAKQALGLVDTAWMVLLCWFFLKGIRPLYQQHPRLAAALLAFLLLGICASGVLQANAGSALRHRTMFSFLMIPVAIDGLRARRGSGVLVRVRYQTSG